MKALFLAFAFCLVSIVAGSSATAQTSTPAAAQQPGDPGITANGAIGEVKVIDAVGHQLIVKTDAGSLVTVSLSDKTVYMRLAPGEKTLTNAAKIAFTDLGEGDRVWARGKVADDHKSVPAAALIVMNKADIAKKQEAERAEWKRRGLLGIITALKPETKEITISSRTLTGQQSINIPISDKVELRRYAPDSIKFADAKPSEFAELKVGDQLRALGERSADALSFTPEKVVTGTFRNVAGTVAAVDAATGEVKINDLQTKQPLTIVIKQDAIVRRFPSAAEMGGMMTMMGRGGGQGQGAPGAAPAAGQGALPGAGQGNRPTGAQGGPPQGGGPGGGRMGGGGMNVQDMLERLPTITIAEVKVGDTIIVSSTKGADPTRLTAISVISGADTLLNMMAARQQAAGQPSTPNPSAGLGSGIQFGIGLP
ncbi:MAG: hypothetical protein ABJB21_04355 [bacterium]